MNIEALLAPVSEAAPCGEDLSFSNEFDAITELRREDDASIDQGEWVTALKTADWPAAQAQCADLLASRSKDLRLAMWWAEAATLTQGYEGLNQGLQLCAGLCERYWDALHPQPEDGDMEQRIGNISWFVNRVVSLATLAPVTRNKLGRFSLQQLQSARSLQATLERTPEKAAELASDTVTLDKFNRSARETPKDEMRQTLEQLQACRNALDAWQQVVDARLGADGPSFVPAREALASAGHELQRLAKEVGALSATAAAAPAEVGAGGDASVTSPAVAGAVGGPPRSRDQALAQLREVAAFFRATEPHSPVAYLADKAVHWGEMPLHQWLRAVVKDAGALSHLEELLGVPPENNEGG